MQSEIRALDFQIDCYAEQVTRHCFDL